MDKSELTTRELESNREHLTSMRRWMLGFLVMCVVDFLFWTTPTSNLRTQVYVLTLAGLALLLDFGWVRPRGIYLFGTLVGVASLFMPNRSILDYVWVIFTGCLCAIGVWYFRKLPNGRQTDERLAGALRLYALDKSSPAAARDHVLLFVKASIAARSSRPRFTTLVLPGEDYAWLRAHGLVNPQDPSESGLLPTLAVLGIERIESESTR